MFDECTCPDCTLLRGEPRAVGADPRPPAQRYCTEARYYHLVNYFGQLMLKRVFSGDELRDAVSLAEQIYSHASTRQEHHDETES